MYFTLLFFELLGSAKRIAKEGSGKYDRAYEAFKDGMDRVAGDSTSPSLLELSRRAQLLMLDRLQRSFQIQLPPDALSHLKEGVDPDYPDRDLTIPNWVDVPCPQCGGCLTPVNANTVEEIKWPLWEHECGYSGPVEWINPDPPSAVWERRRIRATQLEDSGTSD